MNGFLIMYELKKEQTLKQLSNKLKTTEVYQKKHVF